MVNGGMLAKVAMKRAAFFSEPVLTVCAVWYFWKAHMCMSFSALNLSSFFFFFPP